MGSRRSKKKKTQSSNSLFNFQTLISTLSSPQGLKTEILEALYLLLLNLGCSNPESSLHLSMTDFNLNDFTVKFKDLQQLSDLLFDKLNAKFTELFSALDDVSAQPGYAHSIFHAHANVKAAIKELIWLLRCCIAAFKLLVLDQKLVFEKGRIFLGILRRCVSVEFEEENRKSCACSENKVSHECMYLDDGGTSIISGHLVTSICFSQPSNPCHELLCAVLEVFADELLMHESVRQYLLLVDSISNMNESLFVHHFGPGNSESVLEVISAHFILSISDDNAFKNFLNRLFWLPDNNFRVPEMSLTTALSLLLSSIMFSAPKIFQAYVILLVSEVIGISMSSGYMIPSSELRSYLLAFEKSIVLYTRHMSRMQMKGYCMVDDDLPMKSHFCSNSSHMDFESCLLPGTKEKIHNLITECENLWNSYLHNILLEKRSDLVASSVVYTKESLYFFEESSRDGILSILSCIILRGSSDDVDDNILLKKEDSSFQDICLLSSILKLMSGTLLQATRILTQYKSSGSLKIMDNTAITKEYDHLVSIFSCFQQFRLRLPVQKFLHDLMEIHPTRHKKSRWMLFHFSGLLSLSYASGLDFLVKNCIFVLMILLNIFVFEEGDLHALGSLLGSEVKSSSCKSRSKAGKMECSHKAREDLVDQKSSQAVAQKFQKIRTLYLGRNSRKRPNERTHNQKPGSLENAHTHVESALGIEENTGETCNGEIFLRCILQGSQSASDIADLSDFIECKRGKDYTDWLRGREKYKQWKSEKITTLRWKKKRRMFQRRA